MSPAVGATFKVAQLVEYLDCPYRGELQTSLSSIGVIQNATKGQLTFLANTKYRKFLTETAASAVLLTKKDLPFLPLGKTAALIVDDPYFAYAKVAQLFAKDEAPVVCGVHVSAHIHPSVQVPKTVFIDANVVIEQHVEIAAHVQIGAGCVIGAGVVLGEHSKLYPNVTLYNEVRIGKNVVIQSGAVIGANGFGYAKHEGKWHKIPQVGSVVIGDDCEIGANSTIDRGALEDTLIGKGVIIDNQVQVGHNCIIGDHTCLAGCTGISGSTTIGQQCIVGGAVGIAGHIEITDGVILTGMTMVTKSIKTPGVYSSGIPVTEQATWRKDVIHYKNVGELIKRVKQLERRNQNHQGKNE